MPRFRGPPPAAINAAVPMTKSRSGWLWFMAAASPALLPPWLILRYGVDVHFWDEWSPDLARLYVKAHQHQLTFTDLIARHNEHRPLIPRLVYLALNSFTDWNNLANLWTGWIFAFIASLAIWWLIRKTAPPGRALILWFLCNLLIFTPAQSENWLWGIGVANILPMTILAAAVVAAASALRPWLKLLICLLLASAATFTNGNGFFSWALVGAILAWSRSGDELFKKRWLFAVWMAGLAINAALYFYHYRGLSTFGGFYTTRPLSVLLYLLTFSGNAFAYSTTYSWQTACTVLGGMMLAMYLAAIGYFIYCWRKGELELCGNMLSWLAVGGFSVLSALIAGFCRGGSGPQQATNSRYVAHSLFLPIALIGLIPLICDDLRTRLAGRLDSLWTQLPVCLATSLILVQISAFPSAIAGCQSWRIYQRQLKAALLLVNIFPDNPQLAFLFPSLTILKSEANELDAMGYVHPPLIAGNNAALIRPADAESAAGVRGQLERATTPQVGQISATGWAVFPLQRQVADAVFLTYQNNQQQPIIFALAEIGLERHDIATQLGDSRYQGCGWQATFPLAGLPTNLKAIRIAAWALDAESGKASPLEGVIMLSR